MKFLIDQMGSPVKTHKTLLLFIWVITVCSNEVLAKSRHPISDSEIRERKNQCYADVESGLWGSQCKSSMVAKENCALRCLSPSCYELIYESDPAATTAGQETSVVADYTLKKLGLDICADTLVGDDMIRGISGGQKKRVTTGEMLVGPSKALFMDEISTGLDSSTTYQIVKSLQQFVHILEGTAVISLLQPAPETYDLFDDIILLFDGKIVYQGPRVHMLDTPSPFFFW